MEWVAANMLLLFCLLLLLKEKTSATSNQQGFSNELNLIHEEIGLLKDENQNQNKEIVYLKDENQKLKQEITLLKDENRDQNKEISLLKKSLSESIRLQKMVPNHLPLLRKQGFEEIAKSSLDEHIIAKRPARLLPSNVLRGKKKNDTDENPKVFYGPPTNCFELSKLGYTLNGFYQVQTHTTAESNRTDVFTQLETIYCEFKQPAETLNISKVEKRLGLSRIRFYATQIYEDNHINNGKIVKFGELLVNYGKGFNLTQGVFTVPRSGVYQFFFQGKLRFEKSALNENKYVEVRIGLLRNTERVDLLIFDTRIYSFRTTIARSMERTLKLSKGDWIYLKKVPHNSHPDVDIGTGTFHECSFSGALLLDEEH